MAAASRGWRRRVALARATLHRPAVLLLDDPADGLDADGRERLAHELRRHADAGGSALVAASHVGDLNRATHRTVRLAAGRLLDSGPSTAATSVVDAATPAGRA
jgi:ABC-type multidrug transport system ATPase subunit